MKVVSIGGGPAGLFFAILFKKSFPTAEIDIYERNKADDTFGWGVVFSDATLGNLEEADPESLAEVRKHFRYWGDIETFYGGQKEVSTGHGFCGMSRKQLLLILHQRCRDLGVNLHFESEIGDESQFGDADLIVAADGVNSGIREKYQEHFKPSLDWRQCKFAWYGTTKELKAFTFIFKENEHGLFQVHAYPFQDGLSTFIIECHEDTWQRAGLDKMSEQESVAYCEDLFGEYLDGHGLMTNRSLWRTFPTIKCEKWFHNNIVLMGDAVHTAHFSIGSGTKLAMEDAIALNKAFVEHGTGDVAKVLQNYYEDHRVNVIKVQKAAQTSLEWFEHSKRYMSQEPVALSFNLMTRSKQITYDNLAMRDPELVRRATESFAKAAGAEPYADGRYPAPMFTPFKVGELELPNRAVVSPMCQYSAIEGLINDWHFVHYGSRAVGGAALLITEMTDVTADGRITPGCAGLYSEEHTAAWKRVVDFVHANSKAAIGVQLAHAGRKGSTTHGWDGADEALTEGAWQTIAPSAIAFRNDWPVPKEMDRADMDRIRDAFVAAAKRADDAGFDLVELHMAHGYLLSSFISPLSNHRADAYGGDLEGRMRYPLEVFDAVRAAWPANKPLAVRISASDWAGDRGTTADDAVAMSRMLKEHGCALVDVSTGGNVADIIPEYGRMYQVPFAERIRYEVGIPVMAVGAIQGADHCNTILAAGRADLCAMARPHLTDPYLTLQAAKTYDHLDQHWPGQYLAGR